MNRIRTAFCLQHPNGVAISVRGLSVEYPGGRRALENITLEICRGELTVLLGRSGAGKSTLLRCLNLLQQPTAGTIRVDGFGDITSRNRLRDYRRQAGMVFQMHHLIGRQSALQNVLMGRLAYHSTLRSVLPLPAADVAIAMECLERVGLADKALSRVDRLSGGERQRVGIARALAQRPRILFADEPVASLDPATAESIMELLRRIAREDHLTVVFSLHQIDLACRYGERVIGLAHGRLVFDGRHRHLSRGHLEQIYNEAACEQGLEAALSP